MEELSAGTLTRAYREINEVPERRASDIEHLRTWLKKQPHLRARTGKFQVFNKIFPKFN